MTTHTHNPTVNKQIRGVKFTKGTNPSNTARIQEAFINDILRRFRDLRGVVRRTVGYENDALSLSSNVEDREAFDFPRDNRFMRQFREWLSELLETDMTFVNVQKGEHWTAEFLEDAYIQGTQTAQGRLMQLGVSLTADTPEEILERPTAVRQLRDIYTRTFENLQGITQDMAQTIRETLTEGIAEGWNPRKMADRLTDEIQDIERTRAVTLARTETIESHATATLDEYERSPADVGVRHASFFTAKDAQVCPFCRKIEDEVLTLDEMRTTTTEFRGQIYRAKPAAHPNCRCSVTPKIGVDTEELAPLRERVPGTLVNQ